VILEKRPLIVLCLAASAGLLEPRTRAVATYHLDPTSRVVIHVGKAGAFAFAGHAHDVVAPVTGSVTVDPSDLARATVLLEFDSASLRVTGEGEPPADVPEVQRTMLGERVLDVRRYPKIVFRSRRVAPAPKAGGGISVSVEGDLELHGTTRPCVVAVRVSLADGALTAEGSTTIKQSDFGIEPVTAVGGTVRVKDTLDVTLTVKAVK